MGDFLNQATFLEFIEHLEEDAAGGFSDLQAAGEVFQGDRAVSKCKKTQDVIGTQMRRASHAKTPFRGAKERIWIVGKIVEIRCNFFQLSRVS